MSTLRVNNLKSRTGTAVTITSGHGLDVEGNLKITGVSTFSGITSFVNGANVTGVTTFEQASFAQNANFTGILTANSFSGNITGTAGTFSGNVSVGGVLTYEDVTNVDSVGVVTAREGIRIGAGKSIGSDGAAAVYYGDGSNLTGVSAVSLANGVDNRVVTATGAAALSGEADLTFSTGTLGVTGSASGHGINLTNPGNYYNEIQMNANRSSANNLIGQIHGKWNGNSVAEIRLEAGTDTTNKDDGRIQFMTRESGAAIASAMIIHEKGYVTKPKQPSMQVQASHGHDTSTMTPILWDQVKHNVGSCYNTSTGRFTAPIDGHYGFFFSCLSKNGGSGAMVAWARKNGGNMVYVAHSHHSVWGQEGAAIIFYLAANDYIDIKKEKDILFNTYTQWSMCLLS